jgi:hypothetical protein
MSLATIVGTTVFLMFPVVQAPPLAPQATQQAVSSSVGQPQSAVSAPAAGAKTKTKTGSSNKKNKSKQALTKNPNAPPPKRVVPDGGSSATQMNFEPAETGDRAARDRNETDHLLGAADLNLQQLSFRQLSPADREMMKQIRSYMDQAKGAMAEGDYDLGKNLASKANQLSADMLRR